MLSSVGGEWREAARTVAGVGSGVNRVKRVNCGGWRGPQWVGGVGYAVLNRKDLFRAGRLGSRGVAEERITGTILITNELRNFRSRDAQVRGQECPSHTLSTRE